MNPRPLVGHLRERRRVYAGILLLALLLLALPGAPPPTLEGLATTLAEAAHVEVAPDEIVWSSSRGLVADLWGRDVFFVGRRGGPGDVFRARATTTPGGRTLFVRHVRKVTETELADERDVSLRAGWLAWSAYLGDELVSVEAARDSGAGRDAGAERRILVLDEPSRDARWELGRGAIRLELGDRRYDVTLGEATAPTGGGYSVLSVAELGGLEVARPPWLRSTEEAAAEPARYSRSSEVDANAVLDGLEPATRFGSGVDGAPAPVWSGRTGSVEVFRFDGRQLDWRVVPGRRVPRSDTARRFDPSRRPSNASGRDVVTIAWSAPLRGEGATSYSFDGIDYGALDGDRPWGWIGIDGGLRIAAPSASRPSTARSIWPWLSDLDVPESVAWCTTSGGDLVLLRGDTLDALDVALPTDCTQHVVLRSRVEVAGAIEDPDLPRLVGRLHDFAPRVAPPRGTSWRAQAPGSASPSWASSIFEAGPLARLGTEVRVTWIDARRYDWVLVVGDRERPVRGKGSWPETLGGSTERARLALPLASGLRRKPRGLKIDGLVGLPFRTGEGLLGASVDGLALEVSRPGAEAGYRHATELKLTSEEGRLLAAARERGPRQRRADLCLTADGGLLVAEADFDSHEPTASVLASMGCARSAALDRGTESVFRWHHDGEARGPFERTALVGLDRPWLGRSAEAVGGVSRETP